MDRQLCIIMVGQRVCGTTSFARDQLEKQAEYLMANVELRCKARVINYTSKRYDN